MKLAPRTLAGLTLLAGASALTQLSAQAPDPVVNVNGVPSVTISRKPTPNATKPEFTSITVFPGRALDVQQIKAWFPGRGEVDVLASPSLEDSAKMLNEKDTDNGDLAYRLGAAFLFPYPNRIRGKLSADGKTLTTQWQGHTLTLPANSIGKQPGAERHAMHGLILKTKVDDLQVHRTAEGGTITGVIHGGDFNGHWLSKTDLFIKLSLTAHAVDASVTARNVGSEAEPVSIAWHPYFNFPSGDRKQARLHVPASEMAEIDNYDNVFPTGKILPVAGTRFDFQAPEGRALAGDFLDDNFSNLKPAGGPVVVKIFDPAAKYGVSITGISPHIKTIQTYAPPAQHYIAIEHQFNFADPFGKEWGSKNTEMVTLEPGKSVDWHVRLGLFIP